MKFEILLGIYQQHTTRAVPLRRCLICGRDCHHDRVFYSCKKCFHKHNNEIFSFISAIGDYRNKGILPTDPDYRRVLMIGNMGG
jgi:hypothetical protein